MSPGDHHPLPGIRSRARRPFRGRLRPSEEDLLVVEEPLEIRYDHRPVATLMRTPGDDRDLVLGYLYAEGWIDTPADVGALSVCSGNGAESGDGRVEGNIADLIPAPGSRPAPGVVARSATSTASCGICGKRTIEEALRLHPPVLAPLVPGADPRPEVPQDELPAAVICRLPERLRDHQEIFARTGSLHAAGLFDAGGDVIVVREDIGRHNAVDKVVGHLFRREPGSSPPAILQVSGRVSFEIVQKAYRAGIPVVSAVSGVSTLAVDFALRVGLTLVGFAREGTFSAYAHPERLRSPSNREAPTGTRG